MPPGLDRALDIDRDLSISKGKVDLSLLDAVTSSVEAAANLSVPGLHCFSRVEVTPRCVIFRCDTARSNLGGSIIASRLQDLPERVALRIVAAATRILLSLSARRWAHCFLDPTAIEVSSMALAIALRAEAPRTMANAASDCADDAVEAFASDEGVAIRRFPLLRRFLSAAAVRRDFPYLAPEVAAGIEAGSASDVWALGQIFTRMVARDKSGWSASTQNLISLMIREEPAQRISLAEIAAHPALKAHFVDKRFDSGPVLSAAALSEILRRRRLREDSVPRHSDPYLGDSSIQAFRPFRSVSCPASEPSSTGDEEEEEECCDTAESSSADESAEVEDDSLDTSSTDPGE